MLARNYMYVRLRVHAVQWALLLRLEVDNTCFSLSRLDTDLAGTSFDFVLRGMQLVKFRLYHSI